MSDGFPVTAAQIRMLNRGFEPRYQQLWEDVQVLASDLSTPDPTGRSWHHLLLAIGNFKRQTPMFPALVKLSPQVVLPSSSTITAYSADGSPFTLDSENPDTWVELDNIGGIGVPTATTVLAAIWPKRHIIIDRRVQQAAIGLLGLQGSWEQVAETATRRPPITWQTYDWYRTNVLDTTATTGASPVEVERALFFLDMAVESEKGRSWAGYAEALNAELESRTIIDAERGAESQGL